MLPRIAHLKALAVAGAVAASLAAAPAHAATVSSAPAKPIVYGDGSAEVPLRARAQENTNWCWAATGSTIAEYRGVKVSQNDFCALAFGRSKGSRCPNDQATLANDQRAYRALGISAGSYVSYPLSFSTVKSEIKNDRPILTRIEWASGGGHMMVINGVDPNSGDIEWYDPWPSDRRINIGSYDEYVDGYDFSWTHSLYKIGA